MPALRPAADRLSALTAELRASSPTRGSRDGAIALVAREAEAACATQSLLEQVLAAGDGATDVAAVRALLGAADRGLVVEVADAVLAGDAGRCLHRLATLHEHGYDAQRFCRDLLEHVRHLAVLAATGDDTLLADLPEAERAAIASQAGRRTADELQRIFGLLFDADEALSTPVRSIDPQLVLEMAVLRVATLPPLLPVDEILARLEALAGTTPAGSAPPRAVRGEPPTPPPARGTPRASHASAPPPPTRPASSGRASRACRSACRST
jgi:DNA polymerase-3 subunit gamma/tau